MSTNAADDAPSLQNDKRPRTENPPATRVAENAQAHPSPTTDILAYERQYVHEVYSAIAEHFSGTRYKAWPRVGTFLEALPSYSLIADMGCGNGKYFAASQRLAVPTKHEGSAAQAQQAEVSSTVATHRYVVGLDYSQELLRSTQRRYVDPNMHHEPAHNQYRSKRARKPDGEVVTPVSAEEQPRTDTVRCDALRSPLRAGLFDAAISIAVIHHYASHDRRVRAVRELLRLVRPHGGLVLIYVWAREQTGRVKRPVDPETGDGLVPWERNQKYDEGQQVFHRYYHFFAEGELEQLCCAASTGDDGIPAEIKTSFFDRENWCVIMERQ